MEDLLDPTRVLSELEELPPSLIELDKVPRRLWEQTLAPLHRQQRCWIAQQVSDTTLARALVLNGAARMLEEHVTAR